MVVFGNLICVATFLQNDERVVLLLLQLQLAFNFKLAMILFWIAPMFNLGLQRKKRRRNFTYPNAFELLK